MNIKEFLIPAIDIKGGRVVRLFKGSFNEVKKYPYSPSELADIYNSAGFRRIHVVDLDGAEKGRLSNIEHIRKIRRSFGGLVEVGGGIRSYEVAKSLFEEGVDFVVIGTLALKNPDEFERILSEYPGRVILSLDARHGRVSVGGWTEDSSLSPEFLAEVYESKPVWGYLYTIIERDGSLEGVDLKPYETLKEYVRKPVLASGGVSSLEDVKKLFGVVEGVVVGKAIYEGRIPIEGLKV